MKDNKYDKLDNKRRKIEFRWWNKLYNKMFYSYKELYDFIEDMEKNNEELFDKDEGFWKDEIYTYNYALNLDFDIEENSNCVPMQFTGLCDKNGKKIYEGDVVMFNKGRKLPNYENCPELIKWHQGDCAFQRYPYGKSLTISNSGKLIQPDMMVECEVIGNIYDNPELLGGSDEECDN